MEDVTLALDTSANVTRTRLWRGWKLKSSAVKIILLT